MLTDIIKSGEILWALCVHSFYVEKNDMTVILSILHACQMPVIHTADKALLFLVCVSLCVLLHSCSCKDKFLQERGCCKVVGGCEVQFPTSSQMNVEAASDEGITQFYLPPLLPSHKASLPFGWYSLHLPTNGWPGWVDLGDWSHTAINVAHWELNPNTVTHLLLWCVVVNHKSDWICVIFDADQWDLSWYFLSKKTVYILQNNN